MCRVLESHMFPVLHTRHLCYARGVAFRFPLTIEKDVLHVSHPYSSFLYRPLLFGLVFSPLESDSRRTVADLALPGYQGGARRCTNAVVNYRDCKNKKNYTSANFSCHRSGVSESSIFSPSFRTFSFFFHFSFCSPPSEDTGQRESDESSRFVVFPSTVIVTVKQQQISLEVK